MKQAAGSLKKSIKLTKLQQNWEGKKDNMQVTSIRRSTGDITMDPAEIKRIVREYYEQLYACTQDNRLKGPHSQETQTITTLPKQNKWFE